MYHHYDIAVNKSTGVPIPAVRVRAYNPVDDSIASLFSDNSGTPIETVSGIVDTAVADDAGNYSFYIDDGVYTLRIFEGDALRFTIADVPLSSDASLRIELSAVSGAQKVGTSSGATVQAKLDAIDAELSGVQADLDARPTSVALAALDGSDKIGFLPAGAGATASTVEDKLRERVSVVDFGAVMDGATDDSAALAAALATGKEVLVPRINGGLLYINSVVTLSSGAHIVGEGSRQTTILFGPSGQLHMAGPTWDAPIGDAGFAKLGFSFLGASTATSQLLLEKVKQISFDNCLLYHLLTTLDNHRNVTFSKCEFIGGISGSKLVSKCTYQQPGNNWINESLVLSVCTSSGHPFDMIDTVSPIFTHCRILAGAYGIKSWRVNAIGDADPFLLGPIILGCTLDSIDGYGIEIDGGGTDCKIANTLVAAGRTNNLAGVRLTNCKGVEVVGNHFEWCGNNGLQLEGCTLLSIVGNTFLNQEAGYGVYSITSDRISVIGNTFANVPLFGGSGAGNTALAVSTPLSDSDYWHVTGNQIVGMTDAAALYVAGTNSYVRSNPGAPYSTEQGWALGPTASRPSNVALGFQYYDTDLLKPIWRDTVNSVWKDAAGGTV